MLDLEEVRKDNEALERLKLWKGRAKEEEKAPKQGKKKRRQYISLLNRAKKIISRKNPEPLREDPSWQISTRVLYDIIKEALKPEWKKARNDEKKKEEIIRSYVKDPGITLGEEDLLSLHNAILTVLASESGVSESTIKRTLRNKKSPKK